MVGTHVQGRITTHLTNIQQAARIITRVTYIVADKEGKVEM
jgi:hypothetical protein